MSPIVRFFNRLLPFATPGTPLLQDLVHLTAICVLLYFGPQIQTWLHQPNKGRSNIEGEDEQSTRVIPGREQYRLIEVDEDQLVAGEHGLPGQEDQATPDIAEVQIAHAVAPEDFGVHDTAQAWPADATDAGNAGNAGNVPTQRNIGAKKSKSIARRDQRRAYHEFIRSRGEAQRAHDAEGAAEREARLAAERERRRATEAALEAKKAKERQAKREQERREREEEMRRRELAVSTVRRELDENKMCDLWKVATMVGGDVDEEWVEKILKASGMLGKKDGVMTMLTEMGWAVRVSPNDMAKAYSIVVEQGGDEQGRIGYDPFAGVLETVLTASSAKVS